MTDRPDAPPTGRPADDADAGGDPGVVREGLAETFDLDAALPRTLWALVTDPVRVTRAAVADRRGAGGFVKPWRLLLGLLAFYLLAGPIVSSLAGAEDPVKATGADSDAVEAFFRPLLTDLGVDPDRGLEALDDRTNAVLPVVVALAMVPTAWLMSLFSRRPTRAHLMYLLCTNNAALVVVAPAVMPAYAGWVGPGTNAAVNFGALFVYMLWGFLPLYRGRSRWRTAGRFAATFGTFVVVQQCLQGALVAVVVVSLVVVRP